MEMDFLKEVKDEFSFSNFEFSKFENLNLKFECVRIFSTNRSQSFQR